jgi:hypothetical protein
MPKVTPFLMFNDQLEAAMAFYTATFPDSEIRNIARTGTDGPVTWVSPGRSCRGDSWSSSTMRTRQRCRP